MGTLYDTDIVAWASEQAELLRARQWHALDLANIIEEVDEVGKSAKRELKSRMAVLIRHLLKWKFQPQLRSKSWRATIDVQREDVGHCMEETPSLKHVLADEQWLHAAWTRALVDAISETGIHDLPRQPIWTVEDVMNGQFFPD